MAGPLWTKLKTRNLQGDRRGALNRFRIELAYCHDHRMLPEPGSSLALYLKGDARGRVCSLGQLDPDEARALKDMKRWHTDGYVTVPADEPIRRTLAAR